MRMLLTFFILVASAGALSGCRQPHPSGITIDAKLGARSMALQLAATPESQQAGLSSLDALPADQGLLYVFPEETPHFRMENVKFPLDVIFVNSAGAVVSIRQISANDSTPAGSDKPAFYAIEVNRGAAEAAGVKVGDTIAIPAKASPMAVAQVTIAGKEFSVEVARTDDEQRKGLMSRDTLPEGRGMIFVFDDEQVRSFYMKNTRMPLDIVFLDAKGAVVSIKQMAPYDENNTSSGAAAKYAVELNHGVPQTLGLKVGDVVSLPPQAR